MQDHARLNSADFDIEAAPLPDHVRALFRAAPSITIASTTDELVNLAVKDAGEDGYQDVAYDLPDGRRYVEARVARVRNGIAANYLEPYMRRRDPECMVIADEKPTNKMRYTDRFGEAFAKTRRETFDWLSTQPLACFYFDAGVEETGLPALAIVPENCGFFALGLAMLQGIKPVETVEPDFEPRAIIYAAPPFRHTHFEGKQVVVHDRRDGLHELFSYNLYPGPSAKKGIYGVLLTQGEREDWITAHCSTVQVVTLYDNVCTIMHEGASGGGKSEMLEHVHRQDDGRLLLAKNTLTGEEKLLTLPTACELRPVTDDMALCHPDDQREDSGRLHLRDAEDAWFLRVNHITGYGSDPHLERLTTEPPGPLLFLNIDAVPGSRALIWEHIHDAPDTPCPNPRVVVPRRYVPKVVEGPVEIAVRSFGVRTPPNRLDAPSYGILGLFHVLPPALGWLWRLVAPRGHANPSITDTIGMTSEGVGSYWPFATGQRVDQANLILDQFIKTPETLFVLTPNQHIGCWQTSFMPQWLMREYLARRGHTAFPADALEEARCALLGWTPKSVHIEGYAIDGTLLRVDTQPEVGTEGYDKGAEMLTTFFHEQLSAFRREPELTPKGRSIIEACFDGASVEEYVGLLG